MKECGGDAPSKSCDESSTASQESKSNKKQETSANSDTDGEDKKSCSDTSDTKSQNYLEDTRCSETIPSSDSNKENIDCNVAENCSLDTNASECFLSEENCAEYNTSQIPLSQLLKIHVKQLVSGFEFGEATKRQAQENMKCARDKTKNESKKSAEVVVSQEADTDELQTGPSNSKTLSEAEHKTPHSRKRQRTESLKVAQTDKDFPIATRRVPDCLQKYTDCKEVWKFMIFKEEAELNLRNPRLFNDFKSVTPRMRAILLDWLMEVAAVYHLRRVTYYLSVDYFDRFLSIRPDIPKSLLQLVGITCLYIAAKVEEIYPPNLSEFSYVCDGACKSNEMVACELLILNSLGWEVVLTTPSDWLNLYMQLHFKSKDIARASLNLDFNKDFIFPQYSAYQFTRASQLMDLMSLDPGFLKFGYSEIAAAAMYYMYGEEIALCVSGLSLQQLEPCVDYMEVFYTVIKDTPDPRLLSCLGGPHPEELNRFSTGLLKRVQKGPQNENYSFQTHVATMDYFEKATIYRLAEYNRRDSEPLTCEINPEELQPNTPDLGAEECEETDLKTPVESSLVNDLSSLEELGNDISHSDDNLISFDEIFELLLSQSGPKSTNSL